MSSKEEIMSSEKEITNTAKRIMDNFSNVEFIDKENNQVLLKVDTTSIPEDILDLCVRIICFLNNITMNTSNNELTIVENKTADLNNLPKLLEIVAQKGGAPSLKRLLINKGALRNILWFFSSLFTLYFTTYFCKYLFMSTIEMNKFLGDIKFNSLITSIDLVGVGGKTNQFVELLDKVDELNSEQNYIPDETKLNNILLILVNTTDIKEILTLPSPDDYLVPQDKQVLEPWTPNNLIALFTGTAEALIPGKIQQLNTIQTIMEEKRDRLLSIKEKSENTIEILKKEYDALQNMSKNPVEALIGIGSDFVSYMTNNKKSSKLGNVQQKYHVCMAMARLIGEVLKEQAALTPNVPAEIVSIMENYTGVYNCFVAMYAWSGIINTFLMACFGYIINKLLPTEDTVRDDEKYKLIQEGFIELNSRSFALMNDLGNVDDLTIVSCKEVFNRHLKNNSNLMSITGYAETVDQYTEMLFSDGNNIYNSLESMINGNRYNLRNNNIWANIFSSIMATMEQMKQKNERNKNGQLLLKGGRKKTKTRKNKKVKTTRKRVRKSKKSKKGGSNCNKKTKKQKAGSNCNKKSKKHKL